MNGDSRFSFMSEPPSLDDLLGKEEYRAIYEAATLLKNRLDSQPEASGVLTASRTLIEAVCKTVLNCLDIEYSEQADLTDISKQLTKSLDLHPSTKTDVALKQLCQGAINMINGIASLRNAHGDAHGRGHASDALPFRHAAIVAYLSCSLARYFLESYEARIARRDRGTLSQAEESQLIKIWLEVAAEYKMTNPDNLPYSEPLERIAQRFTHETNIVLPRRDIYLALVSLRKQKLLPKPEMDS